MADWKYLASTALLACLSPIAIAQSAPDERVADEPQVALDADNIYVIDSENTIVAEGNVQVIYEGRTLTADKLVYHRDTDRVRATGNVVILDPDGTQRFADEIETDSSLGDGYAIGFSTRMTNGGTATAASAVRESGGANVLDRVVYTACELCEGDTTPTWALRARKAVLDEESKMISYRDAVLEIAGVPVIYLPYFAHPDPKSGRRSGLLTPDVGVSSKLGAFYQQPYYWAISPYSDLTIAPQVNSNVRPLMGLEYRKRFWSGDVNFEGSFTKEFDFDSDGEKFGDDEWRGHLFGNGRFNVTDNWQWGFGLEQMSDDLYSRRYSIDGLGDERGLYDGQPRRLLNQLFAVGQGDSWYSEVAVMAFDDLRRPDGSEDFPQVTPLYSAERYFDLGKYGMATANFSGTYLNRDTGVDSERITVGSDWSMQRVLPGGFLWEPFAEARYDTYKMNNTANVVDDVQRGMGTVGSRISYPLYRPGESVDILIEPVAMVAWSTSGVNETIIPVEDSLLYEFDETSLFEANGYSGYDLYEGDGKADIGIRGRARWKGGLEISGVAGRRWRSKSDPLFSTASNLDGTVSDWVGGIDVDFGKPLSFNARVRLDDDSLELNRIDAGMDTSWWRLDANVRYFNIKETITSNGLPEEGIAMSGQFQVASQWYVIYSQMRNIVEDRDLRQSIGIAYEDDCSRFELAFERSDAVDRTLGPSDSLQFRFVLKTLGNFGSNDTD